MPPMLQEMVISETKEQIRAQIRKEMIAEIKAEEKIRNDMLDMVTYLVPDIMKDIIFATTHHNVFRKDFHEIWSDVPRATVQAAIRIAENTINEMEQHYIYPSFSNENENWDSDSDSD